MPPLAELEFDSEPGPETRFEIGDLVVVLGEPDALEAAEIRLLQGTK